MQQIEQNAIPSPFMLFDTLSEGVCLVDRQWCCRYVNTKAADILGRSREALLGKQIWELFPEALETPSSAQAHRAVREHSPTHFEFYAPLLEQWFECRCHPCPEGLIILLQDISERKKLEQALCESEERMRIALKSAPITVYQQDRELHYTWIHNPLPVYTVEDILGKTDADFIEADEATRLTAIKRRVLETGQGYQEVIKATGIAGMRYFNLFIEPLRGGNGEIIGVTGASIDVTEQIEMEKHREDFFNMANHELKTPITTLKGLTQLLLRQLERQDMQEPVSTLTRMDAQINRLVKLINELLDVSKIQAEHLDYEEKPVDVDALVHETVEVLQSSMPSHVLNVSGTTLGAVVGDRDRLGQVLTNLITNAVKYSPKATSVDILLAGSHQSVTIAVRDYGVGIPQAAQKRIFDRYYRVYGEQDKAFPGLGMGLFIAAEIVKRHGGDITVESQKGQGSTFLVSLPLTHASFSGPQAYSF